MGTTITIEGVDRSSLYTPEELDDIEIALTADSGEVGLGTMPVPTSTPSQEAFAGQSLVIVSDGVTLLNGFIGAMNRDRNGISSGNRLVFHYTQADENALLGGHRSEKWVRPAETDRDRMLAAITKYLGHLSLDTSMVLATHEETLPAKTYMTEDVFSELQTDCGEPTAKGMFIEQRRFHWHRQEEGDDNGIEIVPAASADGVTKFYLDSASPPQRIKDPGDLVVDVVARNNKGDRYHVVDATSQTRHDSSGARHERLIEDESATLAQLTTRADRLLATYKAERYTFEGVIGPLTAAQAALFVPGSLITCTNYVWGLTASAQPLAGVRLKYVHPDKWMVTVDLGFAKRLRVKPLKTTKDSSAGTGGDSGGGDGCCTPWACNTDVVGSLSCLARDMNTYSYTEGGTRSALAILGTDGGGNWYFNSTDMTYQGRPGVVGSEFPTAGEAGDWGNGGACEGVFSDGIAVYGGGSNEVRLRVIGPGTMTIHTAVHPGGQAGPCPNSIAGDITATVKVSGGGAGAIATATQPAGTPIVIVVPDDGECAHYIDIASVASYMWGYGGANWTPNTTGLPPCVNGLPDPGTPVADPLESGTGDGSTTTTTIVHADKFGYVPGSLVVSVNGHEPYPGIHELDADAGTMTWDYPAPLGSDIKYLYDRGTLVGEVIP